jgi:hypothetical protein
LDDSQVSRRGILAAAELSWTLCHRIATPASSSHYDVPYGHQGV